LKKFDFTPIASLCGVMAYFPLEERLMKEEKSFAPQSSILNLRIT